MHIKSVFAILFFSLLLFASCKEGATGGATSAEGQSSGKLLANTDLMGYWVNEAWWEKVKATKSPRQAAVGLNGISGAILLDDKGKILANLSYNWHEGAQYSVRTRDGKQEFYDPNNAATALLPIISVDHDVAKFDGQTMVRLAPSLEGAKAVAYAVLGGEYELNGKTVVFNPKGTVVGLEGYNYFDIKFDYMDDPVGADQMTLSFDGSQPVTYAYKYEGDHLIISEIEDVGGSGEFNYKVGKVKYNLKKK